MFMCVAEKHAFVPSANAKMQYTHLAWLSVAVSCCLTVQMIKVAMQGKHALIA